MRPVWPLLFVAVTFGCASRVSSITSSPVPRPASRVAPLHITIVYPDTAVPIQAQDSSFLFGSAGPGRGDVALTVNGIPVRVAPTGGWLAWVPLPADSIVRFDIVAQASGERQETTFVARIAQGFRPPAGAVAWIDTTSFSPGDSLAFPAGEGIRLSVRATPGARVRLRMEGQRDVVRARHVAGRAGVGRARVRHRYGRLPSACRRRSLRRVAARAPAVRADCRSDRWERHGARDLAARPRHARSLASAGGGAQRRHGAHRHERQPNRRQSRSVWDVQLVLSAWHNCCRERALERTDAPPAVPQCRRLGEQRRRHPARARNAAAGRHRGLRASQRWCPLARAARAAAGPRAVPGGGRRAEPDTPTVRSRLGRELDAARRHRSICHTDELCPAGR